MFLLKQRNKLKTTENLSAAAQNENDHINGQVQVAADQLMGIVEQMKLAAISLNLASTSSKDSTIELTEHSQKTVEYTSQVAEKMRKIEDSTLKIADVSNVIHSDSQSSFQDLLTSMSSLNSLQTKNEELVKSHYMLINQMESLVNYSNKINEIVEMIGSISKKTSILALNASIEAARAGEHGKGFSIVANEVGNLANQTSKAVEDTRSTIQIIQEEIALSTDMVKEETEQVEGGSRELLNVVGFLEKFKLKLNDITNMVADSTKAVGDQTSSVQEIANLLDQITCMAIKNQEQVDKVHLNSDEQHQQIEQISAITDALTTTSDELQSIIRRDESFSSVKVDDEKIENMKNKISNLLNSVNLHQLNSELHKDHLNKFLFLRKEIEAVWSNKLDGTFVYSNPPAGLVNAKARPWFVEASMGKIFVSEVYTSALTKGSCITISYPIRDNDQIVGVLGVDLSLN